MENETDKSMKRKNGKEILLQVYSFSSVVHFMNVGRFHDEE